MGMIIPKSNVLKENDIVVIALANGQTIIGYYQSETNGKVRLRKAHAIAMQATPGGQIGVSFVPFPVMSEVDTVDINNQGIITIAHADSSAKKHFMEAASGIQTVNDTKLPNIDVAGM